MFIDNITNSEVRHISKNHPQTADNLDVSKTLSIFATKNNDDRKGQVL